MRRTRLATSAPSGKGSDFKQPRAATDGKDAKLSYGTDDTLPGPILSPSGGVADHSLRTSKWRRGKA